MTAGSPTVSTQEKMSTEATALEGKPEELLQIESQTVYTVFTSHEKLIIVCVVSIGASFSPLSSNIYYPALTTLAHDLDVSLTLINLSLTTYMIVQGIAPTFIASFSDTSGRRPAYLICFVLYIAANIGLALQSDYAALMILRCVQSAGSSATGALANGVIADIANSAERGSYIGYAFSGALIAQSLGPVIGGLLSKFANWHWIFWFLTILAGVFFIPYATVVPETCRYVVGNGSNQSGVWGRSLLTRNHRFEKNKENERSGSRVPFPNPLGTLKVCFDKEASVILMYSGFIFAAHASVASGIPARYQATFGFNDLQIGLCFIPFGVGSCVAAACMGKLVDRNYRRHALKTGFPLDKTRDQGLGGFPIEVARLQIALPLVYLGAVCIVAYGWVLQYAQSLAGVLILLFFVGFAGTGSFSVMSTLLIDIHSGEAGTAGAANNLIRCLMGAGSSAFILPLIERIGAGWAYTLIGLVWIASSPIILVIMRLGPQWRNDLHT